MSIRKTVDSRGRVRWQVYVYDAQARRSRYVGTFDRRKDAEEGEYEFKRRLRLGERLKPRELITFDELAKRWKRSLTAVRSSTIEDYEKAVSRVKPLLGARSVSEIRRRDIDELITQLASTYAASTVRKTVVVLKMILRMGVDHDYLDKLPIGTTRLLLPKPRKRSFEPLTREQVDALVLAAPVYWRPFFLLLLTSGLRRAEAWGLTVQDLDLNAGRLRVRQQLVKRRLVDLKTDAAQRWVPLPSRTVEALLTHLQTRPANDLDLVFPTPEGRAVDPPNFYSRVWIPAREKAGLPHLRMHDCRHHVASVYLSQGRSIKYVQRVLGHAQPATLLSIYAWVTKDEEEVATREFEKWLGEESCVEYGATRNAA